MEIAYKMTIQDWIASYRIGSAYFRLSLVRIIALGIVLALLAVAFVVFYDGLERAWQRSGTFPWHYVKTVLPAFAIGPAVFIFLTFLLFWLMSARQVTLVNQGVTVRMKGGQYTYRWRQISDILEVGEYIAICPGELNALVFPRRAFPSDQAAREFFDYATALWQRSNHLLTVPQDETVWPPAPRV